MSKQMKIPGLSFNEAMDLVSQGKFVRLPDWPVGDYLHRACNGKGTLKLFAQGHYARVASTTTGNMERNDWELTTPETEPSLYIARDFQRRVAVGMSPHEAASCLDGSEVAPYAPGTPLSLDFYPDSAEELVSYRLCHAEVELAMTPTIALLVERSGEFEVAHLEYSEFKKMMFADPYLYLPRYSVADMEQRVVSDVSPGPDLQKTFGPSVIVELYPRQLVVISVLDWWTSWPSFKFRRRAPRCPWVQLPRETWPVLPVGSLKGLSVFSVQVDDEWAYLQLGSDSPEDCLKCRIPRPTDAETWPWGSHKEVGDAADNA